MRLKYKRIVSSDNSSAVCWPLKPSVAFWMTLKKNGILVYKLDFSLKFHNGILDTQTCFPVFGLLISSRFCAESYPITVGLLVRRSSGWPFIWIHHTDRHQPKQCIVDVMKCVWSCTHAFNLCMKLFSWPVVFHTYLKNKIKNYHIKLIARNLYRGFHSQRCVLLG